jgi:hypothetical protein
VSLSWLNHKLAQCAYCKTLSGFLLESRSSTATVPTGNLQLLSLGLLPLEVEVTPPLNLLPLTQEAASPPILEVVPSLYLETGGDSKSSSEGVPLTDSVSVFAPSGCNIIRATAMSLPLLKPKMTLPPLLEVSLNLREQLSYLFPLHLMT